MEASGLCKDCEEYLYGEKDESMNCGVYQHYKGGKYLPLGIAEHTQTGEQLAIYVPLDATLPGPRIRARPLVEFVGEVYEPNFFGGYTGREIPRFKFVGDL
jgi:hypothetical protein